MTFVAYLLGHPGVGKRTVGRALAERTGAVLVDNQTVNLPILTLFRWDGRSPLPEGTFDRAAPIREAVLSALAEIAPRELSYVLTNVIADDPADVAVYERVRSVAAARRAAFVPVLLTCEREEQLRRVALPDRAERLKVRDPGAVVRLMERMPPYVPDGVLTLDTTYATPEESAAAIAARATRP